ncbi:MAG: hypothetical protein GY850_07810 [bacterium]|nr:hypothetical protein [bacterium]
MSTYILATVTVCDFKASRLRTAPRRLMTRGAGRMARGNGRLEPGSLIPAAGRLALGRRGKIANCDRFKYMMIGI